MRTKQINKDVLFKAANLIIQNYKRYDFMRISIPNSRGCGCMLGFIGLAAGIKPGTKIDVVCSLMNTTSSDFYIHLDQIARNVNIEEEIYTGDRINISKARKIARLIREYARTYI